MEKKVFRISLFPKISYGFVAFMLCVFSVLSIVNGAVLSNSFLWMLPISGILIGVLLVVAFQTRKVVISEHGILYASFFLSKEFAITDIKGYRLNPRLIKVVPHHGAEMTILFHHDFSKSTEIVNWLRLNFEDMNAVDLDNELAGFLQDVTIADSKEKRERKLQIAKEISLAYNIWGGIAGFIFVFFDQKFTFIVLFSIPLIGVVLLYWFDIIKFISEKNTSIYPSIFIGFGVSSTGLIFKTISFSLINFSNLWLPIVVFCALILVLIFVRGINRLGLYGLSDIIITILIVALYGVGSFRALNCAFDESKVERIKVEVLGKKITHSKGTRYGLILNKWGPQPKIRKENVSVKLFRKKNIGDLVTIKLKKGFLNVPWYVITAD